MATANDVVIQAAKKAGVLGDGQSLGGGDLDDGLADLGDMLSLWNEKRWLVWHLMDFSYTSTGITSTGYSVGPSGNFNMTPRPSRIESAFVRQLVTSGLNVDYPLTVVPSREEYSRLSLKALQSFPKYVWYDSSVPLGRLFLYPWPQASTYEIHIQVKDVWPVTLTSGSSFDNYPRFSIPAMKFNLARILRQSYGKGLRPDPELNLLAKDALATMRNAQVQIPELVMPVMLIRPQRYNIYSDQLS